MNKNISIENSKILIVDDTPKNLQLLGNLLTEDSFHLQFALNGEKALESIAEEKPDLILLDVNMPGMTGYDVCREIKSNLEYENIPIIFITAINKDEESIVQGFRAGGVDYVTKPFYPEELVARIKNHLQLKVYRDYLEKLSYIDPLTQLLNRTSMWEKVEYEKNRMNRNGNIPFSLILCDIDHFKNVNDTYGHDCGDYVLIEISKLLKSALRSTDYVARWGGEEFLMLLPETTGMSALDVAEKIRGTIEKKLFKYPPYEFSITMTFGISEYDKSKTVKESIVVADEALYFGKNSGRNRCILENKEDM